MPQEPLEGSILKPSAKQISYAPPLDRLAGAVAVSRIHRMGHGRGLAARAAGAAGAAGAAAAAASVTACVFTTACVVVASEVAGEAAALPAAAPAAAGCGFDSE